MGLVDNISVSCHHWDKKVNDQILGIVLEGRHPKRLYPTCDNDDIFYDFGYIKKVNLSCNLMKGYVDNVDKMKEMLEFANRKGIEEVAFVELMEVNDWCKDNKAIINYEFGNNVLEYARWDFPADNVCGCKNYLYRTLDNSLIRFYIRGVRCPSYNKGSYMIYKDNQIQQWY